MAVKIAGLAGLIFISYKITGPMVGVLSDKLVNVIAGFAGVKG